MDFKSAAEYQYARARQDLQVEDLKRYGIVGLLVDDYARYADVLRGILYRYNLARAFISGSAAEYAPWTDDKAHQFIQTLSRVLIQNDFGIVSGLGLGVGPYVLNGTLEGLENEGTRLLDDRVVLRPFPIAIADASERKRRWTAYHEDVLTRAGVALFIFGNKRDSAGNVVPADGMEEEFRLAHQKGVFVLPVGCTGGTATVLHQRVLDHFGDYYPAPGYRRLFEAFGRPGSPNQVAARFLKIVEKLRDDRALAEVK